MSGCEKNDRVAFQARADYQNHAIGWLHRGYSSLAVGKWYDFTNLDGIWECRLRASLRCPQATFSCPCFTLAVASGVPSWKVPNHWSHGTYSLP